MDLKDHKFVRHHSSRNSSLDLAFRFVVNIVHLH